MSSNGQRPLYQGRVDKSQQRPKSPTYYSTQQPAYTQRSYAQSQSGAPQQLVQNFGYERSTHASRGSSARPLDPPSLSYSRENNDRALSYVYGYDLSDRYRRPQSRVPLSSAGYREMPYVVSQDLPTGTRQNMSFSEASSGGLNAEPYAGSLAGNIVAKPFLRTRVPLAASRAGSYQGDADAAASSAPGLHLKFRRISEALSEAGIIWPSRTSELTADHAIQAFAYFYGLFLPMPAIPYLDFTEADKNQAVRLKDGIIAVDGLLKDLEYSDRREIVAEIGTLSLSKRPHRTISAIFWLMELSQAARLAVPHDEQGEVPYMDQSLEYAEYAVRMIFASSLSVSPDVTVPEAHTYIDAALSRFRLEKEDVIARCKSDIKAIEEEFVEETKLLESETAKLTELEAQRAELESRKHEILSKLASVKSTFASLKAELNNRSTELSMSRGDFETLQTKLIGSGIGTPQRALELASRLQAQQIELEKLESELQRATAKLMSEQEKPVVELLGVVIAQATSYNDGAPQDLLFPNLPHEIDGILGQAASDFLASQQLLNMSQRWKRSRKEAESNVDHLGRLAVDVETKIADLEKSVSSLNQDNVRLRVALDQVLNESAFAQREVQQLEHQLRVRDEKIRGHRPQESILEKQELLRDTSNQAKAAEASNHDLEYKMRDSADRKREMRVLLETYKAAYARIIEGIGQRESVIRQQEQTVSNLQRVLKDFAPQKASNMPL